MNGTRGHIPASGEIWAIPMNTSEKARPAANPYPALAGRLWVTRVATVSHRAGPARATPIHDTRAYRSPVSSPNRKGTSERVTAETGETTAIRPLARPWK